MGPRQRPRLAALSGSQPKAPGSAGGLTDRAVGSLGHWVIWSFGDLGILPLSEGVTAEGEGNTKLENGNWKLENRKSKFEIRKSKVRLAAWWPIFEFRVSEFGLREAQSLSSGLRNSRPGKGADGRDRRRQASARAR